MAVRESVSESTLRCSLKELDGLAKRYSYVSKGIPDETLQARASDIQSRGFMLFDELATLARWKSPRSAGHIAKNSPEFVEEITGIALSAQAERTRIEVLTLLNGVGWPMASVILHFYHPDPYPILDFRALWTVRMTVPTQYDFGFWLDYVERCRALSIRSGLDMRNLDRALWQYSKNHPTK
jgi:hypothetical protein